MALALKPAKLKLESKNIRQIMEVVEELVGKIREAVTYMNENTDPQFAKVDITTEEHKLVKAFESFEKHRNRLLKGCKEAIWNDKYMNLIKT